MTLLSQGNIQLNFCQDSWVEVFLIVSARQKALSSSMNNNDKKQALPNKIKINLICNHHITVVGANQVQKNMHFEFVQLSFC